MRSGKVAELDKAGTGKKVYVHGHMDGKTPSQKQTQSPPVLRLKTFLIKTAYSVRRHAAPLGYGRAPCHCAIGGFRAGDSCAGINSKDIVTAPM